MGYHVAQRRATFCLGLHCTIKKDAKPCALLGFRHFGPKEAWIILKNDLRKLTFSTPYINIRLSNIMTLISNRNKDCFLKLS